VDNSIYRSNVFERCASFVGVIIFCLYVIVQVSSGIWISMHNFCLTPPSRCRFHINMMPFVMESILSHSFLRPFDKPGYVVIICLSVCKLDCVIRQLPFVNLDVGWEQINSRNVLNQCISHYLLLWINSTIFWMICLYICVNMWFWLSII
jgi:hypothetical protein